MKHTIQLSVALLAASFTTQSYCQQETFLYKGVTIALIQGDITTQKVDAIVNAANVRLQHDGGVARAISIAAGPELQKASDTLIEKSGVFKPGTAIETDSFNLSKQGVQFIIHAFGPNLSDQEQNRQKESLLRNAYIQSLEIANDLGLTSIAFPAISTKLFGYNIEEATPVAIKAVRDYLDTSNSSIAEIRFVVFDSADYAIYKSVLAIMLTQQSLPRPMSPAAKPYLAPGKKGTVSPKTTSKTPLPKKAAAKALVKKTPAKPGLKSAKQPIRTTKTPVRKTATSPAKIATPRVTKKAPVPLKKTAVKKPTTSRAVPGKALQKPKVQPKMQKIAVQKTKPSVVQLKEPTTIIIPEPPKIKHVTFNEEPEIVTFQKEDTPETITEYRTKKIVADEDEASIQLHKTKKYDLPTEYTKTISTGYTVKPAKKTGIQLQKTVINPDTIEYAIVGKKQKIRIVKGNFLQQNNSNVWVNASDNELKNHGGLSFEIKKAAGDEFQDNIEGQIAHRKKIADFDGIFQPGAYVITAGYNLTASNNVAFIISTTGPNYYMPNHALRMAPLLETTYKTCLKAAEELNLSTKNIQFPSISTGGFGYPIEQAAPIAIQTILDYFSAHPNSTIHSVSIVLWAKEDFDTYKNVLDSLVTTIIPTTPKPAEITPALLPVAEPTTYTLYDVLKNRIPTNTKVRKGDDLASAFVGSILGGALGDAFGRVTEFDKPIANIFTKRAKGIVSFADFTPSDWSSIPQQYQTASPKIAPWTDDTAMTKVVLEQLIAMKQNKWDFDTTIGNIARATVEDEKKELGWAAGFRAPGGACLTGSQILQQKITTPTQPKVWWDIQATQAGGCGSVMRAHPFGLAFWYNPGRAINFAMAGSKITHGAPIAVAGSACMAVATALAVQQEPVEDIISALIETAKKYAPNAAPNKQYNPSGMTLAEKIERAQIDAEAAKLAYKDNNRSEFNRIHEQFYSKFEGWSADDAVAGTVFAFYLFPDDLLRAIAVGVHTPGDSDSIASMAGALVGAYVGEGQIPTDTQLGAQLEQRKELIQLAKTLANLCKPAKPETPVVKANKTISLPDYLLAKIATKQDVTNLIAELQKPPYAKMAPYPQPTPNWAQAAVKPYVWFYHSYDPYYEFANFWKSPVSIKGSLWPTTEHYFQAGKFVHHPALQEQIRQTPNSSDVFKLADVNKAKKRADWDDEATFIPVMYTALVAKFTQHPSLQKVLLDTSDASIIEDTAQAKRDDMRWGAGRNYQGENYLGRLLMYIRDEIKKYNSGT